MTDPVGSKVKYNNAGYIFLGMVVEAVSGLHFTDYIEKNIFEKAEMTDAGYFAQDTLPRNAALGYIETESGLKTNIFSIPAKGGPDGGAYVSVEDLEKFWHALISGQLLSKTMTEIFLTPQVYEEDEFFYGYGGLMKVVEQQVVKYIQMGYDPGVNYHSVYYPDQQLLIAVCSNKSAHAYEMQEVLEEFFVD
ncbi:serine hydrolase domain-containing protein [Enterococcus casseliflavus]|uniref:serine hydrolase domain-containing protein n=1 Tax=Enterococcus casseliflavus TaxID=37734 RepID=UPI0021B15725|nr:serine hydrolase [Enterococcus casseliflavus]